ncbi:hypothetical protein ACRE_049380 [Hapsidospora chrysogenum ATCC 11550]|uniref:Uncharacterized protein n=1 Tax=Hapsidospora chrysogenum (strain ATCC 11550 / CBS 779.69 / DSM 880 / IAM 14645 / JCM 23072 / IMI 49137) TaxID=857340 RepID=A0A086T4K4_HAPC1|nr:hypothetical protein ACRE_049380 [Hapsidospora chrysogenum ATCC 11550]
MTMTQPHLRARSLSDSTAPAKFVHDLPRSDETKRAAIPRAASTMDIYQSATTERGLGEDPDEVFCNMAREQVDRETLRDLAQFFRNTRPPTSNHPSSAENCFGKSASGENKRWSLRSLRRSNKGKARSSSLQRRDSTVLKTTAAGHPYMAISVPDVSGTGERRPSLQSRRSALQQSQMTPVFGASEKESPQPGSSGGVQRAASMSSANTQAFRSERSSRTGDLAAVVSRSSSRLEKNPYQLSIRVSTAEPGVRSFLKLVDEWLEEQNSDSGSQISAQEKRITSPAHKTKPSVVTLLSPVASELSGDDHDASTPAIKADPTTQSSSSSPNPNPTTDPLNSCPATPPPAHSQNSSFPSVVLRPHSAGTSCATSPQSHNGKAQQPSMFPNIRHPVRTTSRFSNMQKKPADVSVNRTLAVPETEIQPDSPGFPNMLAAMTFPSPPESIRSHSASNSISYTNPSPHGSLATPPSTGCSSVMSPTLSNLDQRIMRPARPPLKHHKSDGAFESSYMSPRSFAGRADTAEGGSVVSTVAQATPSNQETPLPTANNALCPGTSSHEQSGPEPERSLSHETSSRDETKSQRQSIVSTIDSSEQSVTVSDRHRYSLHSDTTAASDMTATDETYWKQHGTFHDSSESLNRSVDRRRSETACSTRSVSSAGTSSTTASLAERRMARRARVREKLQRDLDASKANGLKINRPGLVGDSVDSPVLGWFPHISTGAPHASRKASRGSSPLATRSPATATPTKADEGTSDHLSQRPSAAEMAQYIPETVEETTTPVTPTAPTPTQWTFSSIMVEETPPDDPGRPPSPTLPTLTMSPIMTVANIEARSPSSTLRPLSLLVNGPSPPSVPPRSALRPDGKSNMRQRPLPIRVAKNPLELSVNTDAQSKRNSSPHIPTPPISPDPSSARMSLPGSKPSSAPPSTIHHSWGRSPQQSRQTRSLKDKETEWLTAHQQQTAEDWRMAALKDRMRRERLEKGASAEATSGSTDMSTGKPHRETVSSSEEDTNEQPREDHRRSTLRTLNANAATSEAASSDGEEVLPATETRDQKAISSSSSSSSDQEAEHRLLQAIVPILESMNTTLKEIHKDSASREMAKKFTVSALGLANPSTEGGGDDSTGPALDAAP